MRTYGPHKAAGLYPILFWYLIFFILPMAIMVRFSFNQMVGSETVPDWSLSNYLKFFGETSYVLILFRSLYIALWVTLLCLAIGYPMAYLLARSSPQRRNLLMTVLIIPWWTCFIVRVFAWELIFGATGMINSVLHLAGLSQGEVEIFGFTKLSLIVTLTNLYLPIMVLPLYASLEKLDYSLLDAAHSLGAPPAAAFWEVVVPQSVPGIIAGLIFVFMPVSGTFIVPGLVGGTTSTMIGDIISSQFGASYNWPFGAAMAVLLMLVILAILVPLSWVNRRANLLEVGS